VENVLRDRALKLHPLFFCGVALTAFVVGCGHKATPEECQYLVDRTVELTLKDRGKDASPEELSEAQEAQRKALAGDIKEQCQGRRISEGMLKCARAAQTSEELADCMR
jgi:hypothetical protein